jgi:alpha-methylacyl-CoA racemase
MGPLNTLKVIEFAGVGAGPHCGMLLADMGADVVRIDRTQPLGLGFELEPRYDFLGRGRRSIAVDLKHPAGIEAVRHLIAGADALIESYRPGVMERLGLGPDICIAANPRLVYGRMTGWGQTGPYAGMAGHDINYIALTGALHAIGTSGGLPVPPLNLVGDFGGGALHLAFGVVCALLEAQRSGQGQVVDAAMVEGTASLLTMIVGMRHGGLWSDRRGDNVLDGGAPFYSVYETADGKLVSIGAIEAKFYRDLLQRLGLADDPVMQAQNDKSLWPRQREVFTGVFRARSRDEWCSLLEGTDVCFAPVLSLGEAADHPQAKDRGAYVTVDGLSQPAPVPRFSRTPGEVRGPASAPGSHSREILRDWGIDDARIDQLIAEGVVVQASP